MIEAQVQERTFSLDDFKAGSTEPWIVNILCAMMQGIRAQTILELGAFEGKTTRWLAQAAQSYHPVGQIIAVEHDPERAATVSQIVAEESLANVKVECGDALAFLRDYNGPRFNFAFVDDDHTLAHVSEEIDLLLPHMAYGGIIAMHDVLGPFGLDRIVHRHGGTVLHTMLLHAAGGLGIISIHNPQLYNYKGEAIIVR